MGLVRILVDGYSLLHAWPELARGKPRHAAAARDELIRVLTDYQDASGLPVTVVFDGREPPAGRLEAAPSAEVEVLYSASDQTADEVIERAAHRLLTYGEVLVVTNDGQERDTVAGLGALAWPCAAFVDDLRAIRKELRSEVRNLNRREQQSFQRGR